jgi:trimeric autotransporter adhesin
VNSGNLVVTGTANVSSSAQIASLGVGTAASGTAGEIRATNNVTAYYSDERLKENIQQINNALEKVQSISGVYYTQNKLAEKYGYKNYERQVGVIAQEIKAILPEAVKPAPFDRIMVEGKEISRSGEDYMTVQYEKLVPLLIEAIKELKAEVDELKKK